MKHLLKVFLYEAILKVFLINPFLKVFPVKHFLTVGSLYAQNAFYYSTPFY